MNVNLMLVPNWKEIRKDEGSNGPLKTEMDSVNGNGTVLLVASR